MELGWIILVTLRLTRENILRLRETLIQFVGANPLFSVIIFLVVSAIVSALILKYKNPS